MIPHGTRARDIVIQTAPWVDPDEGLQRIEEMEIDDVFDIEVLPGVADLLAKLPKDRWSIVTSATRPLVLARLRAAKLPLPNNLITAESVTNGKPAPDPYIAGARLLGLPPEDCLVVEDAPAGVGAGIAAGSKTLGVLGTHRRVELSAATWVTPSLASVEVEQLADGRLRLSFDLAE